MNINVVGRIRPQGQGVGKHFLEVDGQNRVSSGPGGASFVFNTLHGQEATTYDVFQRSVLPLVDLCVAGYNTSLILVGESGSGKTLTAIGENFGKDGVVPLIMESIFSRLGNGDTYMRDSRAPSGGRVSVQMYEVYNELVQDLTRVPGLHTDYLELDESADKGVYVKHGQSVSVNSITDGMQLLRQGWSRRTTKYTDVGEAKNFTSVIIYIDVIKQSNDNPFPNKSRFSIVLTPGAEKLAEDSSQLRLRESPTLSKSLVSMAQLAATLGNQPYPDRVVNYNDSKLTYLLRDELGGNCRTTVLVCLKPQPHKDTLTAVLQLAGQFSTIKNFPILNDPFAQYLLTQYQALILNMRHQLGFGPGTSNAATVQDAQQEVRRFQTENVQLRDQNERLHQKLDQLQNKFGHLATTKSDISTQLLMTEEEKLKVSKTLVDMQIENNKLKEETEASKFELTNKVLHLENDIMELELERDKHFKAAKNAKERLTDLERDRKELADEYVALKSSHLALKKAHEEEAAKNEEMSVELLNLVNAKAALMRQMERREMRDSPSAEVDRVRAIVSRLSHRRPEEFMAAEDYREDVEKNLFGTEERYEGEFQRLRVEHEDDKRKLEVKMAQMKKDLNDARNMARERQRKASELTAQLLILKSTNDQLQSENNRMQHKLQDVQREFKSRLDKYVEDVARYIDSDASKSSGVRSDDMQRYVGEMLRDMRKAYKVREEQLSQAAQTFRTRMTKVIHRHEQLLIAYRQLRQEIESRGYTDVDLGPDEATLAITDPEIASSQQKEIARLRDDLIQAQSDLEAQKTKVLLDGASSVRSGPSVTGRSTNNETWTDLRRQMREMTMSASQDLEKERAQLLTRNSMLEEENKELQDYIDGHLVRYKEEIVRLREISGVNDAGGFTSPAPRPQKNQPRRR